MTPKEQSIETHGAPAPAPAQPSTTTTTTTMEPNDPALVSPPPDYLSSIANENEGDDVFDDRTLDYGQEDLTFPADDLTKLEEQINRPRWTVPVLANGELIRCVRAAIRLAAAKVDTKNELCQRFYRDCIVSSFTKILCDDAVNGWKYDIQSCIYKNVLMLIRLCVLKLPDDCFPVLEALGFIMNPDCRFHIINNNARSEYQRDIAAQPFGSCQEFSVAIRYWLVDFLNKFGDCGGFDALLARFQSTENKITTSLLVALLKPWGLAHAYLTQPVIKKYFAPIIEFVPQFLDQIKESDLKFEIKSEAKSDTLSTVMKWLRNLASHLPEHEQICRKIDLFRLKLILRLLQTNSFNGKMHALNELNKLLSSVQTAAFRNPIVRNEDTDALTSEKCMRWIQDNQVLDIVLRDCLHQPQYVEKLERLLRFLIKEQGLSRTDLDKIWSASSGKHEAIEKNVHDLLAKLAWDFSPDQLEQLFDCFRESWTNASKKQREKLLELIRRLAEDDKEGHTANKTLELLWTFARDEKLPIEITEQALAAHLKILDCSYLLDKEKIKLSWIERIVEEIKNDRHVIVSMKHLRDICSLFSEHFYSHNVTRMAGPQNRLTVVNNLEQKHEITRVVTENLCRYMEKIRKLRDENKKILPAEELSTDGRFNHNEQIHERLTFIKFIFREARLHLTLNVVKSIWRNLAEQAVYPFDRQQCFRWFAETVEDVGLEYRADREFFQEHLMKLDPHLLTDLGMTCFDRLFKSVNGDLKKFQTKGRNVRLVDNENLVGIEYLWKLILQGSDDVAQRGTQLIKEIYTKLSPPNRNDVRRIHESFINDCYQRLKTVYESIQNDVHQHKFNVLTRILFVFREYLSECDLAFHKDRMLLPMFRAFRGRSIIVAIRVNLGQNRATDDFEYSCHSNDTWGQIRRWIQSRYPPDYNIMEMFHNSELVHNSNDNKTIGSTDEQDRIIVMVRWVQPTIPNGSSPESSSSESEINGSIMSSHSSSSRQVRSHDQNELTGESALPSVILSSKHEYCQFLIELADLACHHHQTRLRDTIRQILDLIPLDLRASEMFNQCLTLAKPAAGNDQTTHNESSKTLEKFFFDVSPSQMLYNLKTILINLNPAIVPHQSNVEAFHVLFLHGSGLRFLLRTLSFTSTWEQCDPPTRKSIYFTTFLILKRILLVMGLYKLRSPNLSPIDHQCLEQIVHLMQSTVIVNDQKPLPIEQRIVQLLLDHSANYPIPSDSFLEYENILEILRLIWCLASNPRQKNFEENFRQDFQTIHQTFNDPNVFPGNDFYDSNDEIQMACREGLELFCISIALVSSSVEKLLQEKFFANFLIDLVLYCHYPLIRRTASDQFLTLTIRVSQGNTEDLTKYLIDQLCQTLNDHADEFQRFAFQSNEFFQLLCRLLSFAFNNRIQPENLDQQLSEEIIWLKTIQSTTMIDDYLLRGHLNLAKELIQFQNEENKRFYGIDENILSLLIEEFLFPASTLLYQIHQTKQEKRSSSTTDDDVDPLKEPPAPICQSPMTTSAAFDLLVALGTGCLDNLKQIDEYLSNLFYTVPDTSVNEWDFALPIGPRPPRGFVGLKNASATCYMNSVLQQLFMIRPLRNALLAVKIPSEYGEENDLDDEEVRREPLVKGPMLPDQPSRNETTDEKSSSKDVSPTHSNTQRTEYHIQILRHIQRIFGHLLDSKLQYYTPRGFWKTFKFGGEAVNLRDQHDAVEFLNTLVESIDEALKTLRLPQFCAQVLGGKFADQKICKDCPHRYSREEDFTLISVDIRHSQNLKESLEQYVIGELLEGPNAYHCEKCDKKVDTVKRTCFKKLPPILGIQLKRFDYDWERETPIKFNDYFEFPRELDMEPFTVQGLAKAEGTPAIVDNTTDDSNSTNESTRYRLVGIIVHMGQANGGHYYSFIQYKDETDPNELSHWCKFDDGEVSDCRMDEDEELRSQCFGGDHTTTAFDQPSMKRQRRWWNAYILFYERVSETPTDPIEQLPESLSEISLYDSSQRMPLAVQRSVRKQNMKFLHNRIHLSPEYFTFMKTLVQNNVQYLRKIQSTTPTNTKLIEETALTTMQITIKFIFSTGWRVKKTLRGPASEWGEVATQCMRVSSKARRFLADELLVRHPNRFQEYFLDCNFGEIRGTFARMLVSLATLSRPEDGSTVEDSILDHVLRLIKRESMDSVKLPPQYFVFFITYAAGGRYECKKLIEINVPMLFIGIASDDMPSAASLRNGEADKLFVILSTLIRCFDVSTLCKSSQPDGAVMPNPHSYLPDGPICVIPEEMIDILYKRTNFLKKLIEEMSTEDSIRLLRFLIWENPDVTVLILSEIVAYIATHYSYDSRTYNVVIRTMLTVEDSWQEARIMYLCRGISIFPVQPRVRGQHVYDHSSSSGSNTMQSSDNVHSLFDSLVRLKSSYPKRLYQFIKLLLELMNTSEKVCQVLINDLEFKKRWIQAVEWLTEHLDRPYHSVSSNYSCYSNQNQNISNDQLQSHNLERTPSTKSTLESAAQLYSELDIDDGASNSDEMDDDELIAATPMNPGSNSPILSNTTTTNSDIHSPSRQQSTTNSSTMGQSPHHNHPSSHHSRA